MAQATRVDKEIIGMALLIVGVLVWGMYDYKRKFGRKD